MNANPSERRTPPESEEDHAYLWEGARKAHELWRVLSPLAAVISNWKAIAFGLAVGLAIGGKQLLISLGLLIP